MTDDFLPVPDASRLGLLFERMADDGYALILGTPESATADGVSHTDPTIAVPPPGGSGVPSLDEARDLADRLAEVEAEARDLHERLT